jgi:hypothetical protein
MRAEALLLSVALLATGCVAAGPALAQPPGGERPRIVASPPLTLAGSEVPERMMRRRGSREDVTVAGPGRTAGAVGSGRQNATLTYHAVLDAVDGVKRSTSSLSSSLSRLAARKAGIGGANGVFARYIVHGSNQLQWINGALGGSTTLADVAMEVGDADMALGILRMTGPRLQAAMSGAMLLAAWLDFLSLADAVLQQCPSYSAERLFADMSRVQKMIEPSMTALSSLEPGQVEATALALPELMGQLIREFQSIREGVRVAMERGGQLMTAAQLVEMVTLVSTMKLSLPRPPPAAPAVLGVSLVMGSNGVMMGSRIVVSAEWVEMMRRLVHAGVISIPAVSAAVRINAGQVMMAQAHRDLPRGVRDALGDGPEVRGMHETGRAGAGMSEPPQHHVMPREHREWFEKRGFTDEMSIDKFCVRMEEAHHQAIHGGGDWRRGRMWPGEWNQMIMEALRDAEAKAGRMLTRNAILKIVAKNMRDYKIPMDFTRWRGQ